MVKDTLILKVKKRNSFRNQFSLIFLTFLIILFIMFVGALFYNTINSNFIFAGDYVILKLGKTFEFNYKNQISTSFFYIEPIIGKIYLFLGNLFLWSKELVNYKYVHFIMLIIILFILFFQIRSLNLTYYEFNLKSKESNIENVLPDHYLTIFSLVTILGFLLIYFFFSYGNIYNLFLFFTIIEIQHYFLLYLITEDENYNYYSIIFWLLLFLISLLRSLNLLLLMFISFMLAFIFYFVFNLIRVRVIKNNKKIDQNNNQFATSLFFKVQQYFVFLLFLIIFIVLMYWKTFLYAIPFFNLESLITFYSFKQNWFYFLAFLLLFLFYLFRINYSRFWLTIYYIFFFSLSLVFLNFFFDKFTLDLIYYYHISILVGFAILNVFLYEKNEKFLNLLFLILFMLFIISMNARASYSYFLEDKSKNEEISNVLNEIKQYKEFLNYKEMNYLIYIKNSSILRSYEISEKYSIINSISLYFFESTNLYYFSDFVIFPYLIVDYVFRYYYNQKNLTKVDVLLLVEKFSIDYVISDERIHSCFEEIEGKTLKLYSAKECKTNK